MLKADDNLWNSVVKEGLGLYEERSGYAHFSTLILVGKPKSVII